MMEAIILKKVAAFDKKLEDIHTVTIYNNNILNDLLLRVKNIENHLENITVSES